MFRAFSALTKNCKAVPTIACKVDAISFARAYSVSKWRATTILCCRKDGQVVMAGDGQVSLGPTVCKGNARKVRRLHDDILVGFAGSTADALTLLERLESKLDEHPGQLMRACVELAKAWRSDKYLRRLEATLLVADANNSFELTGNGDVLEPESGAIGIGSGGTYALASALALIDQPEMTAEQIVRKSMKIAGDICVYTNHNLVVEVITPKTEEGAEIATATKTKKVSEPSVVGKSKGTTATVTAKPKKGTEPTNTAKAKKINPTPAVVAENDADSSATSVTDEAKSTSTAITEEGAETGNGSKHEE